MQVERVKEHFDDRERIADFVRDFGGEQTQRGKLFVLAELFLDIDDSFVEAGLFNRDPGKLGERGENANFLVRKAVGFARINTQRADACPRKNERNTEERDQPLLASHLDMLVA